MAHRIGMNLLRTRSQASIVYLIVLAMTSGCGPAQTPTGQPATSAGDAAFTAIAHEYLEDLYRRQPTWATDLGIHRYDDRLEDYSRQAVTNAVATARQFRARVAATDEKTLSAANALDRELILRTIDSGLLTLEVVRPWAKDPDIYSGGLTNAAYIMIKRNFAPPEDRLRKLIAREKAHARASRRGPEEPR